MKLVNPIPKGPGKSNNEEKTKIDPRKVKIKKFEFRLDLSPKRLLIWFLVIMIGLSFLSSLFHPGLSAKEINLSQALVDIKENRVKQVLIDGDRLLLTYHDGEEMLARKEPGESLVKIFESSGIDPKSVEIRVADQTIPLVLREIRERLGQQGIPVQRHLDWG